jgi:hypothetical protein
MGVMMKILNHSQCEKVAGGLAWNQYSGYSTLTMEPYDTFYFNAYDFSFGIGLGFNGCNHVDITNVQLLTQISGSDPFAAGGITIGTVNIVGTQGSTTNYTIYNV